jgi:hypothetical protein
MSDASDPSVSPSASPSDSSATSASAAQPRPAASSTVDETAEIAWCDARLPDITACLERNGLDYGRIGDWPAWHVMPYAGIWAVESRHRPEWIGWWAIAGDLPTDVMPAMGIDTPRDAMRAFAKRWANHADALERGEVPKVWAHQSDAELLKLTALLKRRGAALQMWADDNAAWPAAAAAADDEDQDDDDGDEDVGFEEPEDGGDGGDAPRLR